jgi:NarL family two-component system response regulator LiaR
MPDAPVAIVIVEDDSRYRSYLRTIVDGTPGFRCAGAFASAEAALATAAGNPPDVVLMDLELPGMPGVRAISAFRERLPRVDVLVLTFHSEAEHLFPCLEAGACGYLVKPIDPAQLVAAVQEARNGGAPMSGPIARLVLHSFRRRADERRDLEGLTARELEVLRLIATGTLPQETAGQLGISERTVQTHLRNIYDKLHVHSRSQAVARFLARDQDRP